MTDTDTNDDDGTGLYERYYVEKNGEPVLNCFVLEPKPDEDARVAIRAYAEATDDDELAADLHEWMDELDNRGVTHD